MTYQNTFKRYEIKYLLSTVQKQAILTAMEPYMRLDKYGRVTIRNIYFDTDNFRLIRRSIEKPVYKEKLRLRSYALSTPDSNVFVELKKKYKSVVYKRRLVLPECEAMGAFLNGSPLPVSSQIGDEIEYFREYYGFPSPRVFLAYDREAYHSLDRSDLRITFDDRIIYRTHDLSLCSDVSGTSLLADDSVLLEVKTAGSIPLWLAHTLTEHGIYKTSFSKYGRAYADICAKTNKGVFTYA